MFLFITFNFGYFLPFILLGVGLVTPRGTGTSGHVVKNLAFIPNATYSDPARDETQIRKPPPQRQQARTFMQEEAKRTELESRRSKGENIVDIMFVFYY